MSNVSLLRPGGPTPQRKRDRTRAALLGAGEALMAEHSADGVTVDEIVAAAGVSKGTFYNYFADKDALQLEVLQTIRIEIRKIAACDNATVSDPARRIVRTFLIVLRFARDNPRRGRFLTRTDMVHLVAAERPFEGLLKDIAAGLAAGRLRIDTTDSAALLSLGLQHVALVRTMQRDGADALPACAQHLGEMLLRGLGLPLEECGMIAAQEVDRILCGHSGDLSGS